MDVSGRLHALDALLSGKNAATPVTVCKFWRTEKRLAPTGILFCSLCVLYFIHTSLSSLFWLLPFVLTVQNTHNTNIRAPGGIRTRNPSKQEATDPRLRPLGHWDRPYSNPGLYAPLRSRYAMYAVRHQLQCVLETTQNCHKATHRSDNRDV